MASVRASEAEAVAWLCERLMHRTPEERGAAVQEFLLRFLDMHAEAVEQEKDIGEAFERALRRAQDLALEACPTLGFERLGLMLEWSGLKFALSEKLLLAHRFRAKALRRLAELGACQEKATGREATAAVDQARARARRREAMLEAFKRRMIARGVRVSNKQIYDAAQHSCRKPDFYAWLKGKLPDEASATQSLERFLSGDEAPKPRKSGRKEKLPC
jgi:hypothetical protein